MRAPIWVSSTGGRDTGLVPRCRVRWGNVVVAGHRVTHTRPFLDIDHLVPGDLIVFHLAGTTTTYRVTGHQIVGPDGVSIADPDFPYRKVTLLACHPKGSAAQRYVVRGELIPATSRPASQSAHPGSGWHRRPGEPV